MAIADADPVEASASAGHDSDNTSQPRSSSKLSAGAKNVDAYNFRQPRIFSHDQIRLLNYVHDAFARSLSVFLSDRIRTIVDVRLDEIEQLAYSHYVSSCKTPTALFIADEFVSGQKAVFEVDPSFILFTLEKSLGGTTGGPNVARHLSPIERRYMSRLLVDIMQELSNAWGEIAVMTFQEAGFESNAEFIQIIPGSEPVLVSRLRLVVFQKEYYFHVCYPYLMLRQVLGRTGIKQWLSRSRRDVDAGVRDQFTHHLGETPVELRVELGRARLSLADVQNLQIGDVIPLHKGSADELDVFIDDRPFCSGQIGRVGKHLAVGVSNVVNNQEHD